MTTTLKTKDVQTALAALGYYDGAINGDAMNANYRDDLKQFQKDYGLTADGLYGLASEGKLLPLWTKFVTAQKKLPPIEHLLRWHCTSYYIGNVRDWSSTMPKVPMMDNKGRVIAQVPWRAFSEAALEGTTMLVDGRLANVASNPSNVPCDAKMFAPVFNFAKQQGWLPEKAGYAGIVVDKAQTKAVSARAFEVVQPGKTGYPISHGIDMDPFRTLAADIGAKNIKRHDPKFKGKGGVVPIGTKVFILEYFGKLLPDGTTHDGWFTVCDTGGGIFGAHFDTFTGTRSLRDRGPSTPDRAHIWYQGCDNKLGWNYTYGL